MPVANQSVALAPQTGRRLRRSSTRSGTPTNERPPSTSPTRSGSPKRSGFLSSAAHTSACPEKGERDGNTRNQGHALAEMKALREFLVRRPGGSHGTRHGSDRTVSHFCASAESSTASQTSWVSSASRKVGEVGLPAARFVRKSATWWTNVCS